MQPSHKPKMQRKMQLTKPIIRRVGCVLLGSLFVFVSYFFGRLSYVGITQKAINLPQLQWHIQLAEGYFVFSCIVFLVLLLAIAFLNLALFFFKESIRDEFTIEQALSLYNTDLPQATHKKSFIKKILNKFSDWFIEDNR